MERTIEAIKKWMIAESFDSERQNNQFLEGIISLLSWTLRNMVPVVLITRVRDNDIQLGDITVRHELSGGQSLVA